MVPIVPGSDYTPQPIAATKGGHPVQAGEEPPIFALLCTKGGTAGNVVLRCLGDNSDVTIPSTTFKQGVVYPLYLKELVDDNGGDVEFIGLRYRSAPLTY